MQSAKSAFNLKTNMIKLAISGCQGRIGTRITQLAQADKDFKISALLEYEKHPAIGIKFSDLTVTSDSASIKGSDVLIEFTTPDSTIEHLKACVAHKVKMVIGTTGLNDAQIKEIDAASKKIPIVFSSNMSVGVNLFFKVSGEVAEKIGKSYTMKITEAHHIHKKDAPSGTAKTLAQIVEGSSKAKVADIKSIREGEIIGDHDIVFESDVDTITIRHHAKTRDIFAGGSLVAAKFLAKKQKGLFNMQDVLGLK